MLKRETKTRTSTQSNLPSYDFGDSKEKVVLPQRFGDSAPSQLAPQRPNREGYKDSFHSRDYRGGSDGDRDFRMDIFQKVLGIVQKRAHIFGIFVE